MFLNLVAAVSLLNGLALATGATPATLSVRLRKRQDTAGISADSIVIDASRIAQKYARNFRSYKRNRGADHPLTLGIDVADGSYAEDPRRDVGYLPLEEVPPILWRGNISVGTPPQTFSMDFDTGSSDTFLAGPNCTNSNCKDHKVYYPGDSSTAQNRSKTFEFVYGDSSKVSGEQWTDTVTVANLTAQNQTVGVANIYSAGNDFDTFPVDGLVGMAYQSVSTYNATPLFQNLAAQNSSMAPVFAFRLTEEDAEMTLGGVNASQFTGNISWTPVVHQAAWEVNLGNITVNNNSVLSNQTAVVDTGTSQIIGPAKEVKAFYKSISGSKSLGKGVYTVPCNFTDTVGFVLGNTAFNIPPSVFNHRVLNDTDVCIGVVNSAIKLNFWLLGDQFMRSVYTVFDFGYNRVGFATLNASGSNSTA